MMAENLLCDTSGFGKVVYNNSCLWKRNEINPYEEDYAKAILKEGLVYAYIVPVLRLRTAIEDQPGIHVENRPSMYKTEREPNTVVHSCRLSNFGGWGLSHALGPLGLCSQLQAIQDCIMRPCLKWKLKQNHYFLRWVKGLEIKCNF